MKLNIEVELIYTVFGINESAIVIMNPKFP